MFIEFNEHLKVNYSKVEMSQTDILTIDAKIKQQFNEEAANLPIYRKKIVELEKTLTNISLSSRIYKGLHENIVKINKKIQDIDNINFYIAESADLLEKYKKKLQTPLKLSFTGKSPNNDREKRDIIAKYLEIAQKYTDVSVNTPSKYNKIICNNCPNKKHFDIIDNSIYICLMCGAQQEILLHTSSYKDIDRINISAKYTYDRKVHFRDCINQYQGTQNSSIDPQVYVRLEDQFDKHHLLIGDSTSPKEKRFKNITKDHIHLFLKELEFTTHYENVNLIHYQMTGNKPDDISYLENKLLDDFDILTDLYDKKYKNNPRFSRKNFINTQYVLYQFLSRYRHPCRKEDFTILKTVDRKSFHDDVAKELFIALGWNHYPLF